MIIMEQMYKEGSGKIQVISVEKQTILQLCESISLDLQQVLCVLQVCTLWLGGGSAPGQLPVSQKATECAISEVVPTGDGGPSWREIPPFPHLI